MFQRDIDLVRVIHAERVERDLAAARIARAIPHGPRSSIRRVIGRSIVRLGSWVAAEPTLRPARSQ